jgi:hypothetical protein
LLAASAGAAGPTRDRKFLFVFAFGGWDTTRVLAPKFGVPGIAMERGAEPWHVGAFSLADHPDRPSVRAFFEEHHQEVALLNGILVPSVAHETCTRMVMTGSGRGRADWAASIGAAAAEQYVLPNLVLDAPTFPEEHALAVARAGAGGQLDGLVSGAILDRSRPTVEPFPVDLRGLVDRHVLGRTAARAARGDALGVAFDDAARRAVELEEQRFRVRFTSGGDLASRTRVAIDALASGLSRVVTVGWPSLLFPWDTHYDNDPLQSVLWEQLFDGLRATLADLAATPGPLGGTLADETVVVVLSEMGRTPGLNAEAGKDHWPWTSAMLLGAGVRGGQVLGAHDDGFAGAGVDRATGALDPDAPFLDGAALGATLLALADVDPGDLGAAPLEPLLS